MMKETTMAAIALATITRNRLGSHVSSVANDPDRHSAPMKDAPMSHAIIAANALTCLRMSRRLVRWKRLSMVSPEFSSMNVWHAAARSLVPTAGSEGNGWSEGNVPLVQASRNPEIFGPLDWIWIVSFLDVKNTAS